MRSCVQRRSGSGSVSFRACLPRLLPRGASGGTPRLVFCPGQGEALAPDVLCRIDVGVGLVPAVPAFKPALRPPVGGVDRPALAAGPAGIHGRDGYEGAAVPPALVLELQAYHVPALEEDGPVEAGLLPDVGAGVVYCPLRRFHHVAGAGVLDGDHVVVLHQLGGDAVLEAVKGILAFLLYSSELGQGLDIGPRWALGPAESLFDGAAAVPVRDEAGAAVFQG